MHFFIKYQINMENNNYNSSREKLILPEYGRNVVFMVDDLLEIEDRDERNKQAKIVIDVMGNINPTLRDSNDYKHKIWDHLFILSDFKLDIDSPYEIPSRESLVVKPEKIPYRYNYITHKQYGNNIREVLNLLRAQDDNVDIEPIAVDIAKFMKQKSYEYNQEYPSNLVVLSDIRKFTNGEIVLEEDTLNNTSVAIRVPYPKQVGGQSNLRSSKMNPNNPRNNSLLKRSNTMSRSKVNSVNNRFK